MEYANGCAYGMPMGKPMVCQWVGLWYVSGAVAAAATAPPHELSAPCSYAHPSEPKTWHSELI